jgi:hypothetical protein
LFVICELIYRSHRKQTMKLLLASILPLIVLGQSVYDQTAGLAPVTQAPTVSAYGIMTSQPTSSPTPVPSAAPTCNQPLAGIAPPIEETLSPTFCPTQRNYSLRRK